MLVLVPLFSTDFLMLGSKLNFQAQATVFAGLEFGL